MKRNVTIGSAVIDIKASPAMRSLVFLNHENQITRILSAIVYILIGILGIIKVLL